jgi:hypothetical protein
VFTVGFTPGWLTPDLPLQLDARRCPRPGCSLTRSVAAVIGNATAARYQDFQILTDLISDWPLQRPALGRTYSATLAMKYIR